MLDYHGLTAKECLLDRKTKKMRGWIQNLQRRKAADQAESKTEVLAVQRHRTVISTVLREPKDTSIKQD